MKLFLTAAVMALSVSAMAETMICEINEMGAVTKTTTVTHEITPGSHRSTPFESAYATGFIAVVREYKVVNLVSKEDGRVFSFFGKADIGSFLGGTYYMADGSSYLTIECR